MQRAMAPLHDTSPGTFCPLSRARWWAGLAYGASAAARPVSIRSPLAGDRHPQCWLRIDAATVTPSVQTLVLCPPAAAVARGPAFSAGKMGPSIISLPPGTRSRRDGPAGSQPPVPTACPPGNPFSPRDAAAP